MELRLIVCETEAFISFVLFCFVLFCFFFLRALFGAYGNLPMRSYTYKSGNVCWHSNSLLFL